MQPLDPSQSQTKDEGEGQTQRDETLEQNTDSAALQDVRCLLKFIDSDIKQRKEFVQSIQCQSVSFGDIWFLFNPGELVTAQDSSQAYKVVKITVTRHKVQPPKKGDLSYWRDDTKGRFEDNPVRIHCVHIDFDGTWIGPVRQTFSISRFEGEKHVISLPVYPLRFSRRPEIHAALVERGKQFVKVAAMKYMHYSGLTLDGRDDIDSQVVVDFEEALTRNPDWRPEVESVIDKDFEKQSTADEADHDSESSSSSGSYTSDISRRSRRRRKDYTRRGRIPLRSKSCVEECCALELCHHDDYVETRRMQECVAAHMDSAEPGVPSLVIHPRRFRDITDKESLSEDELLIMSRRVFGFVMRSRKWGAYQQQAEYLPRFIEGSANESLAVLDLDKITEVATLGDADGFDQLVLPSGHKDMVKSLIRQHLRDKNSGPADNDQMDIVRGKGTV